MDSRIAAILEEPERFLSYLKKPDLEYIHEGRTQPDRIMRLKERFEGYFLGTNDYRGEHFIVSKGEDIRDDPEYYEALMKLYNCEPMRKFREEYPEIARERKTRKEVKMIVTTPQAVKVPKAILIGVQSYMRDGIAVKAYKRSKPYIYNKLQRKWVYKRKEETDNKKMWMDFNAKF